MKLALLTLVTCLAMALAGGTVQAELPPVGEVLQRAVLDWGDAVDNPENGFSSSQIAVLDGYLANAQSQLSDGYVNAALATLIDTFYPTYMSYGGMALELRGSRCTQPPYDCDLDCATLYNCCVGGGSDGCCALYSIYCGGD